MLNEELVHEEERDGLSIRLYFAPEEMDPRDSFDEEIEKEFDTFGKIERGELLWFSAHVTASAYPGGPVLGEDYLGGCCYSSAADFIGTTAPSGHSHEWPIGRALRQHNQEKKRAQSKHRPAQAARSGTDGAKRRNPLLPQRGPDRNYPRRGFLHSDQRSRANCIQRRAARHDPQDYVAAIMPWRAKGGAVKAPAWVRKAA